MMMNEYVEVVHPTISHSFSLLAAAAHVSPPCMLRRTSFSSSLQPTFLRLSFFSPRAFLFSSRLSSHRFALFPRGRCAHHFSRRSASASFFSPLLACSSGHFPVARFPRLAAYIRRRCSRVLFVRSFAHSALSFSLRSRSRFAQLCFACASALPHDSPSAFSLLVPRLSSLPGSTPLIKYICLVHWRRFNLLCSLSSFNSPSLLFCVFPHSRLDDVSICTVSFAMFLFCHK